MTLISLLIIGGGSGWLAHRFLERSYGPIDDVLLGMLGALFGATIADLIGLSNYGIFASLLMTLAGAGFLLLLTNFKLESEL